MLLVAFTAPEPVHTLLLGILLVAVLALLWFRESSQDASGLEHFATSLALAKDEDVMGLYTRLCDSLKKISEHNDPILRDLAIHRTEQSAATLEAVAEGRIVFVGTETWRVAYERLLRSPGLHLYRSVAVIETSTYWQDEPGKRSLQLNFAMMDEGTLNIERIAIIADHLWPKDDHFPVEPVREWIETQHNHGLWIKLVRRSEIAGEPQLIVDLGIYGNRAVGVQELDDQGRTVRFTLSFDFEKVLAAEQRWDRLAVYATSYRDLLDRKDGSS
ncbi:MAG: hypothetical protein DWQ34_25955 [Planctomycetota bacterium]|nr:MAG: hypothetical protein DWQ34_25955 [Planctomycetota bacterium]REK25841.1 MAG: hypothetical protein DWQ41_11010 [Planctomycetota bacterium]REK37120.1 MAG: hypothetical protein DWQ45_07820 [Planctomycetota bacterium]